MHYLTQGSTFAHSGDTTNLHVLKQKVMWYVYLCVWVFCLYVYLCTTWYLWRHQIATTRVTQLRAATWVLGIKLKVLWKSSQCAYPLSSLQAPVCIFLKHRDRCTDMFLWHFLNCSFRCSWCSSGGWQWFSASSYWLAYPTDWALSSSERAFWSLDQYFCCTEGASFSQQGPFVFKVHELLLVSTLVQNVCYLPNSLGKVWHPGSGREGETENVCLRMCVCALEGNVGQGRTVGVSPSFHFETRSLCSLLCYASLASLGAAGDFPGLLPRILL